jgi:ADP-heptose:LPS heptosyltransferase
MTAPPQPAESPSVTTDGLPALLDSGQIKRVLFSRPERVGDVLFMTPILRKFKARYPDISVSCLTSNYSRQVLAHHPLVDDVLSFDPKASRVIRWYEYRKVCQSIRDRRFDLAIQLSANRRVQRCLERAGVGRLVSNYVTPDFRLPRHVVEQLFENAGVLGIEGPPGPLELYPGDAAAERAEEFLKDNRIAVDQKIAVIHPGCFQIRGRRRKPASWRRVWPAEHFARLAEGLHEELGLTVVFSANGRDEARMVGEMASGLSTPCVLGLDLDIAELGALLERTAVFVSVDTGPMHVAAAMRTPLIALFGPSPPHFTGPWGDGRRVVLNKDLPCSPCRGMNTPCSDNICMKQITPDYVVEVAGRLIGESEPDSGPSRTGHEKA